MYLLGILVPMEMRPLAEQMRPETIKDVIGQDHLLAKGKVLRELIEKKELTSLILWGPPGSGKTTLARIIANHTGAEFIELSAVSSGKADVMKVIEHAKVNKRLAQKTLLFIDEVHRFNKAQQDAFLPHVENGTIVLIGATTENPSFEVISPLLSRSRVLVLQPLAKTDIITIIKRTLRHTKSTDRLTPKAIDVLARLSDGDARVALGNLELVLKLANPTEKIKPETIETAVQKRLPAYDKKGEHHFNIISAFIKSMRGGDANAAYYYLARMLQAGEDPKFIARRMVIFASEDVGIAASSALNLAVSTFQAVERIGMPECQYNLYHCALVLAKCQKSRVVTDAMHKAQALAKEYGNAAVPLHIRNAPTSLMKDLGYGKDYQWKADFKHDRGFMPGELQGTDFFQ